MIKYLFHLISTNSPILSAAFETNIQLSHAGVNTWFKSMLKLLTFTNLEHLIYTTDSTEVALKLNGAQKLLREKYDKVWLKEKEELLLNSKLDFLVSLKEKFELSPHLICSIPPFRSAITKIRVSAHKFPIETGRYLGRPREDRLCPFGCKVLGNECHYLFQCRHPLIEKVYTPILNVITEIDPHIMGLDNVSRCKAFSNTKNIRITNLFGKLCHKVQDTFKLLTF